MMDEIHNELSMQFELCLSSRIRLFIPGDILDSVRIWTISNDSIQKDLVEIYLQLKWK